MQKQAIVLTIKPKHRFYINAKENFKVYYNRSVATLTPPLTLKDRASIRTLSDRGKGS